MAEDDKQIVKSEDASGALKAVEERLAGSESLPEIVLWTQVRGELLRQNDEVENRRHQRELEKLQLSGKIALSVVAMMIGILLLILGHPMAGFFALGAGLFWLAPDFVKAYLDKFNPKE